MKNNKKETDCLNHYFKCFCLALQELLYNILKTIKKEYDLILSVIYIFSSICCVISLENKKYIIASIIIISIIIETMKFFMKIVYFEDLNFPKIKRRYTKVRCDGEVYIDIKDFQISVLQLYRFEEFAERNGFIQNEKHI